MDFIQEQLIDPVSAVVYVLLALVIIAVNITNLPRVIEQIIGGAFGIKQIAGGFTGGVAGAMVNGVKRVLFSNEAGMAARPTSRPPPRSRIRLNRA